MTFKSRKIDVDKSRAGTSWFTVFGGPKSNITDFYVNNAGKESIGDNSPHRYITTGEMTLLRKTMRHSPCFVSAQTFTGAIDYFYDGKLYANVGASTAVNFNNPVLPTPIDNSTMLGYGVKGWNRYKPTSRNGSLAQAIVELKDVPKMLQQSDMTKQIKQRNKNVLHHAGSQYLNIQFGWLPLLSDVRELVKNAIEAQRRIDQLARDNGKWVRRGGTIHTANSTTTSIDTGSYYTTPTMITPLNPTTNTRYNTTETRSRFWFSGKFRYYIAPPKAGRLSKYLLAEHVNRILYGTDLSPSLLYELMPWSWLTDWFSSAGSSIANFFEDSGDNLVAEYACTMGNTIVSEKSVVKGVALGHGAYECSSEILTEVKRRTKATPYGFYAITPSLTAKQASILIALGLTSRLNRG